MRMDPPPGVTHPRSCDSSRLGVILVRVAIIGIFACGSPITCSPAQAAGTYIIDNPMS